jgi:hypothetical protein
LKTIAPIQITIFVLELSISIFILSLEKHYSFF